MFSRIMSLLVMFSVKSDIECAAIFVFRRQYVPLVSPVKVSITAVLVWCFFFRITCCITFVLINYSVSFRFGTFMDG